uniref:Short-chain dehydrogenase n=1 Tax=Moniliophthora roreri TaxID=221103 RepID=A0A0W0G3P8_MONRR
MATRNREKAQEAIKSLKKDKSWKDKGGEVVWLRLNSSDPREAKKAVKEFLSKEKRLDVLMNNATLLFDTPFEKTVDGPLNTIIVNYISLYIFTDTVTSDDFHSLG